MTASVQFGKSARTYWLRTADNSWNCILIAIITRTNRWRCTSKSCNGMKTACQTFFVTFFCHSFPTGSFCLWPQHEGRSHRYIMVTDAGTHERWKINFDGGLWFRWRQSIAHPARHSSMMTGSLMPMQSPSIVMSSVPFTLALTTEKYLAKEVRVQYVHHFYDCYISHFVRVV